MDEFHLVQGHDEDLELLVSHRLRMWMEISPELSEEIRESENITRKWILEKLLNGTLIAFLAKTHRGDVAGSGCLLIKEDQPRPGSKNLSNPYLLSMYTEENFRGLGVATLIVKRTIEWSREHGFDRISLHASVKGRSVYERLGFVNTNEMRLLL